MQPFPRPADEIHENEPDDRREDAGGLALFGFVFPGGSVCGRPVCGQAHRQAEAAAMKPATPPTLRPANGGTNEDGKTDVPPSTQIRKMVFGSAHVPLSRTPFRATPT